MEKTLCFSCFHNYLAKKSQCNDKQNGKEGTCGLVKQGEISTVYNEAKQRGMCIKGLFWPPLEPKTESCFSPISSYWFVRGTAQM